MKILLKFIVLKALIFFVHSVYAEVRIDNAGNTIVDVSKTCLLTTEYADKSLNDLQKLLLNKANVKALSKIYGTVVKLNNEQVEKIGLATNTNIAILRPEGNIEYANGDNFGEICVTASFKALEKDIEKLKPKTYTIDKHCYSNKNVAIGDIKDAARNDAIAKKLKSLNPKLNDINDGRLLPLSSNITIENENLDFNTLSYCADYSFSAIPLAVENYTATVGQNRVNTISKKDKNHISGKIITAKGTEIKFKNIFFNKEAIKNGIPVWLADYERNSNININDIFSMEVIKDSRWSGQDYYNLNVLLTLKDKREFNVIAREHSDIFDNGKRIRIQAVDPVTSQLVEDTVSFSKKESKIIFD